MYPIMKTVCNLQHVFAAAVSGSIFPAQCEPLSCLSTPVVAVLHLLVQIITLFPLQKTAVTPGYSSLSTTIQPMLPQASLVNSTADFFRKKK
jgi:hypothetical protein